MARKYTSKCHFTCWFLRRGHGTDATPCAARLAALVLLRRTVCSPAIVRPHVAQAGAGTPPNQVLKPAANSCSRRPPPPPGPASAGVVARRGTQAATSALCSPSLLEAAGPLREAVMVSYGRLGRAGIQRNRCFHISSSGFYTCADFQSSVCCFCTCLRYY